MYPLVLSSIGRSIPNATLVIHFYKGGLYDPNGFPAVTIVGLLGLISLYDISIAFLYFLSFICKHNQGVAEGLPGSLIYQKLSLTIEWLLNCIWG